jgi:putative addiction module killer protein
MCFALALAEEAAVSKGLLPCFLWDTMFPMRYELEQTAVFQDWLESLDAGSLRRVLSRLARVERGNFGDHKEIAKNLFELRCFFGGGIRMYGAVWRQNTVVFLLVGGDKDSQERDIKTAKRMMKELED